MIEKTLRPVEEHESYVQLHDFVEVHGAVSETTLTVPTGELARPEIVDLYNGFGAFKKTMGPLATALADYGIASFHSAPIRGSSRSPLEDIFDPNTVHLDTHREIFNKLASNKELANLPNGWLLSMVKRINAGHSYGGETATENTLEHPDEVEGLVLIESVGLEAAQRLRFARRAGSFLVHELVPFVSHHGPDYKLHDGVLAAEHLFGNPFQTIGEARACNRSDIREALPVITSLGIGLAVLAGRRDHLLPAAPMREYAKPHAHYYEEMPVNHLGPQQYATIVGYFVSEALDRLAQRHEPNVAVHNGIDLIAS
ncbi:MAG TPA: alpha/beta hydrolase [Candidatus Saccharimonadales bacterium]|nr:alpha/beta hydrolase [Candidatus Saccharimonadales bacterium]